MTRRILVVLGAFVAGYLGLSIVLFAGLIRVLHHTHFEESS